MSALRTLPLDAPDLVTSRLITLVRVRDGEMEFATTRTEKRQWLNDQQPEDHLCAIWTGQFSSHAFKTTTLTPGDPNPS